MDRVTVLVTGSQGKVGRHVVAALERRNVKVVGVDIVRGVYDTCVASQCAQQGGVCRCAHTRRRVVTAPHNHGRNQHGFKTHGERVRVDPVH